jgi:hypothetical protein
MNRKNVGLNLGFPLQSIDALSLCCNNDNGSMIVYLAQNIWSSKCPNDNITHAQSWWGNIIPSNT